MKKRLYLRSLAYIATLITTLLIAAHSVADSKDYKIGPSDVLSISVFGHSELNTNARVSDSGEITFPLIGILSVDNLSTRQVEVLVENTLKAGNFIKNPNVTVLVEQYQSKVVAVMGSVLKPGLYPLKKTTSVIELLAAAGGIDKETAGDRLTILGGNGEKTELDLSAIFSGANARLAPVENGDTLYVATFDKFYIYGEVQKPGVYKLESGMTVAQAIATGGGLTPRGTESKPLIKRRTSLDESELQLTVKASDFVQPNDTIYIKEDWF